MLTPTDIHLLVGVFSKLTTPDNVDIVLGEMVYDEAAQRKRDIDITIRYKNEEGEEVSFVGLQVKDHGRKLGSPEVEQLCLHFKDSRSIKKGGIVSASGYSKPAIKKAAYHQIDLYEFRDWDHSFQDLPHVRFNEDFKLTEVRNVFIKPPDVNYIFDEEITKQELGEFNGKSRVQNIDGTPIPQTSIINELNNNFINKVLQYETIRTQLEKAAIGAEIPINVTLTVETPPVVILSERQVQLKQVNVQGILKKVAEQCATQFKILVKLSDPAYQVGSAISEMSNGLLVGFSTSNNDKSLRLITIPVADRLREKIHQIKIK